MMRSRRLGQKGDTLIEVMLSVAILSSVLAGCYSISQRSLRIAQSSSERIYALKLLEGQVEMMRRFRDDNGSYFASLISAGPSPYCFNAADLLPIPPLPLAPKASPAGCTFGPDEVPNRYTVKNSVDNTTSPGSPIYVFRVEWEALDGGEVVTVAGVDKRINNVEYRYRLN